MFDAEPGAREAGADELSFEFLRAELEAVRPRRTAGEVIDAPMIGRLQFSRMPRGRPSFWHAEQQMPDSRFALRVVCEVDGDRLPGADQMACVVAFRRLQVQDAMLCAPLINARLQLLRLSHRVTADDLVLTLIYLPPHPLTDARFELGFRVASIPQLLFTCVFGRGVPRSVRIDSDS